MRRYVLLVAIALLVPGCGLGAGEEREGGVQLRVTRDFGRQTLATARLASVREDETVMRFLRREREVDTRFGGRFVQAIDGLEGSGAAGHEDWFFYVNGIESSVGAAEYELSPGDRVQWDYRDWAGAMRVPAIVGAFPEPFRSGLEGKRRSVRVECEDAESRPCELVKERLRDLGVAATGSSLGASGTQNVIRVVVGRWRAVRLVQVLAEIEEGPQDSGVFARPDEGGTRIELLDDSGDVVRRAEPGSGLIAAVAPSEDEIVWAVTGVDSEGVERAAERLGERALAGAFALVVESAGSSRLPLEGE